jgi:hypothetical protein
MIPQLDVEAALYNLTTYKTILTDTPDENNAMMCYAHIEVGDADNGLDAAGGNFDLRITIDNQILQPNPMRTAFTASNPRAVVTTGFFSVPAGAEVKIEALSSNGNDIDVAITATLYNAIQNFFVPSVDTSSIFGF